MLYDIGSRLASALVRTALFCEMIRRLHWVRVGNLSAGLISESLSHGLSSVARRKSRTLPLLARVAIYFVLADFGHYWIHRLMHHQFFWRVHKWHHSPTYMYWLGGVRATLPQQFLVNIPYVLAYPVLNPAPWWIAVAIATISTIQNDWVHLNVSWKTKWINWIFVTPRFHHIHPHGPS